MNHRTVATLFIVTSAYSGLSSALECWGCTPGVRGLQSFFSGQGELCEGDKVKITCLEGQQYCIKTVFQQGFNLGCSGDKMEVGEGCYDGFYYYGKLGKSKKAVVSQDASSQPLKCYCKENLCNSSSGNRITVLAAIASLFVIFLL